jgi:cyclophilin family peptidyl-prolyl cis-trans isomerase
MRRCALGRCGLLGLAVGLVVPAPCAAGEGNPVVVMDTSLGKIRLELFAAKVPVTVKNFLRYVDEKFYDGTVFHRVIAAFMIQGGGMDAELKEKPTRPPIKNEAGDGLSNVRGTIAMARAANPDSATVQFFINVKDNLFLDRARAPDKAGYTVFGRVIAGMEVIDKIRRVKTANRGIHSDVPVEPVVIRSVRRAADLTVALGGSFAPGSRFTITAYVDFPVRGQTLTLELPSGVECVEGKALQPVAPSDDTSLVVWRVRVLRPGTFAITVRSSTGLSRSQTIKSSAAQTPK